MDEQKKAAPQDEQIGEGPRQGDTVPLPAGAAPVAGVLEEPTDAIHGVLCTGDEICERCLTIYDYLSALRARCEELEAAQSGLILDARAARDDARRLRADRDLAIEGSRRQMIRAENLQDKLDKAERDRDLLARAVRDVPRFKYGIDGDNWREKHAAAIDAASKIAGEK